jgi:hypothetical protein
MTWLVSHDLLPGLTAKDAPPIMPTEWMREEGRQSEFSILLANEPIGRIWTTYLVGENSLQRTDLIWISRFPVAVAPLRLVVDSVFTGEGELDELTVKLATKKKRFHLHGERFHSDFSFTFDSGPVEQTFKVPLVEGGLIGGALSPFAQLTDIEVGQTWRMQMFNPIAALTGMGDRFMPMLIKVTGEERISTPEGECDCLVIESSHTKAWVDSRGVVMAQQITLPVAGTLRIVRQPEFDEDGMLQARRRSLTRDTRSSP